MSRVLLYADVDLNLIDGSSVWLASLAELLTNADKMAVTILQRTRIQREIVIQQLKARPNVRFVDPWDETHRSPEWAHLLRANTAPRLSPNTAASLIQMLDQEEPFDVFIVRSLETAERLSEVSQLACRLWVYITDPMQHTTEDETVRLRGLFKRVQRFLCQTQEAKGVFQVLLQTRQDDKLVLLPPMIPAVDLSVQPRLDPEAPRLGYAGKFSPPYMILEMLDAFEEIRSRIPKAEFHVVGDKFHNVPPTIGFEETVNRRLQNTPGVIWYGGVSREETHEILRRVHVASSWRDNSFDASLEMSTKILEYSALGIPVLMNSSSVQSRIYGPDYPAYVECKQDFVEKFIELTSSQHLYQAVSTHVQGVASNFTYARTLNSLMPLLIAKQRPALPKNCQNILFVGHDFKFLSLIIEHFRNKAGYKVLTDQHEGHVVADEEKSHRILQQADIIFCEWCLGNAEWYSRHKRPTQKLVIRFHRQEIDLPFLEKIQWENVDRIVFICESIMRQFLKRFPFMADRALLLYNIVDTDSFVIPKFHGAEFNLGLLGMSPKLKAPHLAFEILTRLKTLDKRYTLFVKGKHPQEYDWLWRRAEERQYYEDFFATVNGSEYANSVVFEPHGEDVPAWFSKVGFILSTSDFEGSHQAVAEGMASGAIPIIRNWTGADAIYPQKYIFRSVDEAVELITKWHTEGEYLHECCFCQQIAHQKFDKTVIAQRYDTMFAELLEPMG
jgi:glycosyltransferase involved in cell wall biosynthesis